MLDLICARPAGPWAHPPLSFSIDRTRTHSLGWALLIICAGLASPAAFAAEAMPAEAMLAPPFNHYQRWRDEPLLDWREVNARVGQIGGWRTYLRESQEGGGVADTSKPGDKPSSVKPIDKPSDKPGDKPAGNHSQHGQ